MSGATYSTVQTGPYSGFTRSEMQTEFARYKSALTKSGSGLSSSSIQGNAFSFGPRRDWTLMEWGKHVRNALAQVDPAIRFARPSQTIRAHF